MSDIALCNGPEKCPISPKCRRAVEKPEGDQEYVSSDYYANSCNRFVPVETSQEHRDDEFEQRKQRYFDLIP